MAGPKRKTSNRPGTPGLVLRALVLAVLWVAVNWWVSSHFGRSLTEIGTVNAVLVALAAILGLLPESEKQAANAEKSRFVERLVMRLLSPWVLAALVVVFLTVASVVSSVHVERGDVAGDHRVELYFDGKLLTADDLRDEQTYLRFPTWTRYGGRQLTLQVSGFGAQPVDLHPWRPSKFRLDELHERPRALIRLDYLDVGIFSAGSLRLVCLDAAASGQGTPAEAPLTPTFVETDRERGLVGLGTRDDPGQELVAGWVDELLVQMRSEAAEPDAEQEARVGEDARRIWSHTEPAPDPPCLEPGRVVRVVLCTSNQDPWAATDLTLRAGLQVVQLAAPTEPGLEADPFDTRVCEAPKGEG